mgnify:CR=1 FL=1
MPVTSEDELNLMKRLKGLDQCKKFVPHIKNPKLPQIQIMPILLTVSHMYGLLSEQEMKVGKIEKNIENLKVKLLILNTRKKKFVV